MTAELARAVSRVSILDVFPPGRRRDIVMAIAEHPEWDDPDWKGILHFRLYRNRDGSPGCGKWVETMEETLGK